MNFEEERRAPMPNNPYLFNGSRTGPNSIRDRRKTGGRRRNRSRSRKNRSRK